VIGALGSPIIGEPFSISFVVVSRLDSDLDSGLKAKNIPVMIPMTMGIANK
jgi:hypothetical protein